MKFKSIAMAICTVVCAGAVWAGVDTATEYVSASETAVDISAGVTISGWQDSAELKLLTISFDKNVLADFNYDAMDTEAYAYIQEYLYFNGKSVKEINADTSLGAINWEYTQFPGNASDKYKVPVLIYERDAARLRLYIHENYFNALGANPTFEIKEGLSFVNEGATYTMNKSRKFVYDGSAWENAKDEKDITADVQISGWKITGSASELSYTKINFGAGVLPSDLGYHILDNDIGTHYHYIKDYITINGKTIGEINANTDVSNYVFSSFPSTAADKYKLPVILFGNGDNLEVKIHNDYLASLGADTPITIGVKEGLSFNGTYLYKVSSDVTAVVRGSLESDITSNVAINGWDVTGDASELTYTRISLGEGVLSGISYGIMDNAAWTYIQDYITINGRTVADINTNVDDSAYAYSTFPSTADDKYKVPVMIFENAGKLEVKVHNDYIASLGENATITIGVKEGLYVENNGTKYVVKQDIASIVYTLVVNTYTVTFMADGEIVGTATYTDGQTSVEEPAVPVKDGYTGAWESYTLSSGDIVVNAVYTAIPVTDITANVTVEGWDGTGDASELTYTRIKLGEGVMPAIGYGIIDGAYKYMQDYITINGRTVADINTNVDDSAYVYSTFPSTADDKYKVPVMIYVNAGTLEVKFHNDYIATLGEDPEIIIGVKAGLSIAGDNVIYKVTEYVAVTVKEKIVLMDVTANVTIGGWKQIGDLSELTRTIITLGEGVMPAGVDYGIMDTAKYGYLQEYITINGKTIKEINETTDVSNYVFHTFPSTASAKYQIPVIVFVNGDNLEIKIHNDYLVSLGGNIDVIVGVKAGFSITNGSTIYNVTEDVENYVRRKAYTLTVELNPGMDVQYLTVGSEIVLEAPQREHYVFEGWFEKGTDNAAATVMPEGDYTVYAKYTAIEYTITFMNGEEVVGTAIYTLNDTEIEAPELPTKEGYTSAWESYTLTGGDITVNVVYTKVEDVTPPAGDESSSEEDKTSSDTATDSEEDETSSDTATDPEEDETSSDTASSPDAPTSDEDTASNADGLEGLLDGCFASISGLSIGLIGLMGAATLLKKKEDE
ncbi:MAG: InlB B-repeat-containing protein [Clostridia bacterium]|nr:InlB B-repeat-containing protein [Clostridia bacterium]